VNPRLGATFRLFTGENGLDLARAYYLDMTGQRVPASVAREGRKWIVRDLDFASSLRYYKRKQLTGSEWLKSLFGVEESAYFAADDPLPLLVRIAQDIVELGRRARKNVPIWGSNQPVADPFSTSVSATSEVEVA
jgi:predicted ATP-grasp superfamily ATP-dependent carboligase